MSTVLRWVLRVVVTFAWWALLIVLVAVGTGWDLTWCVFATWLLTMIAESVVWLRWRRSLLLF